MSKAVLLQDKIRGPQGGQKNLTQKEFQTTLRQLNSELKDIRNKVKNATP